MKGTRILENYPFNVKIYSYLLIKTFEKTLKKDHGISKRSHLHWQKTDGRIHSKTVGTLGADETLKASESVFCQ